MNRARKSAVFFRAQNYHAQRLHPDLTFTSVHHRRVLQLQAKQDVKSSVLDHLTLRRLRKAPPRHD
jgi:hypothetical protein